jgi:pyridoxamine 5'-phosphate oxidase family protein
VCSRRRSASTSRANAWPDSPPHRPTASPDVSAVGFSIEGDTIVSGGLDLTKTVRYRHLRANPRATVVIDDLASVDPWAPRGVKVRGEASLEDDGAALRIRIVPVTIWSWGLNVGAKTHFAGRIEKRSARG